MGCKPGKNSLDRHTNHFEAAHTSHYPQRCRTRKQSLMSNTRMTTASAGHYDQPCALRRTANHVDRLSQYPAQDGLTFEGIDAPSHISQIPKVERQNNLAISVFGWDKGIIIHRLNKHSEDIPRINLMLIEKAGKFHYTWIKDLNRLLNDQSKNRHRKHFCERCLHGYIREDLLEPHMCECHGIGQTAIPRSQRGRALPQYTPGGEQKFKGILALTM